jgi:hypothetical protein
VQIDESLVYVSVPHTVPAVPPAGQLYVNREPITPGIAQSCDDALVPQFAGIVPHTPAVHTIPVAHTMPHAPQLFRSVVVSTHVPAHDI